ncbi:S-adenosyl-L-methionine-dependent methyltransferase [Globomyces pollinis-pini]|nr:S-adenosyl-L-methionine-dependent methyltransferase [Globomyces pollinis-pini]
MEEENQIQTVDSDFLKFIQNTNQNDNPKNITKTVKSWLENGGNTNLLSPNSSLLHYAVPTNNIQLCSDLIQYAQIPWNTLDNQSISAGELAYKLGHLDLYNELVQHGVRAEFVLSLLGQRIIEDDIVQHHDDIVANSNYLNRPLTYTQDGSQLLDSDANAVMMGWEDPLMKLHAKIICPEPGKSVLNVGFGLGLVDNYLQLLQPAKHTIIEAHPDVYRKMIDDGWDKKPGVTILFGRWQDVLDKLECYDGIFFDTFGEYYDDLKQFHQILPNILDEQGVYSFFNGLAGTNQFFHDVACEMAVLDLREMGLRTVFEDIDMETLGDDVWKDTKRTYWSLPVYRIPTVTFDF